MKAILFVLLVVALLFAADLALAQGYYGGYAYQGYSPRYGYGHFSRVGFTPYPVGAYYNYNRPYMGGGYYYGGYGRFGYGRGYYGGAPLGYGPQVWYGY